MPIDFKKFLSYLLVGIKKFFEKKLTPFLRKYHDTLLLPIFIPSISFLFVLIIVQWMSKGPRQIFFILLFLSISFILTYIFLSKEQREKINRHQSLVAILAILIPALLFFWQQANDSSNKFVEKEMSLKEENNRNYNHLKNIIVDPPKYPDTMLWTDFSLISYQQDWDQIQFTKSQDCRDLYAALTIRLGIMNNINKMRQQLVLVPNDLSKFMLEAASSTLPIFNRIISECQAL